MPPPPGKVTRGLSEARFVTILGRGAQIWSDFGISRGALSPR